MVERDKNHPASSSGRWATRAAPAQNFGDIEAWIRDRDPSRPIHYERDRSYRHSDFHSVMYPALDELEAIGRREEPTPEACGRFADDAAGALPHLLCEYGHAMGNGPGSLADYQRILESHDRFCGAFIWEWVDHGLWGHDADGEPYVRHGGDLDQKPNGERYCLDGLCSPTARRRPGLIEYAKGGRAGRRSTSTPTRHVTGTVRRQRSGPPPSTVDGVRRRVTVASRRTRVPQVAARPARRPPLPVPEAATGRATRNRANDG